MAKQKVSPPRWWDRLETGDKIICVVPYALIPGVYEVEDVATFIAREGGGLRIKNRGEVVIVPHDDFLPYTPGGMEYAGILHRLNMDDTND